MNFGGHGLSDNSGITIATVKVGHLKLESFLKRL